jgi:hypothetical protein
MSGSASWEQLWAIVGLMAAVAAGAAVASWRVQVYLATQKAAVEARLEHEVTTLEARLGALETFQAGTMVILKHVDEFRLEMRGQYEALRETRRQDMEAIHRRLDAMHNAARLLTSISEEGIK